MKDAKGHGSNARGNMSVFDKHEHRIARDTLRMNPAMAGVMGGPTPEQATRTLREKFGYSDADIARELAGGHPKAAPAPVHSGAAGRSDSDFGRLPHGETFRFTSERDHPFSGMAKGPWTKTSARGYTHAESGGKYKVGSTKAKVMKP